MKRLLLALVLALCACATAVAEAPAWRAPDYNSCADTTRWEGGSQQLLLVDNTVYALNGAFADDWDWVPTRWTLSRYPQWHPEQAQPLLEDLEMPNARMWDAGDGLMLRDDDGAFFRVGYDGDSLRPVQPPRLEADDFIYQLLPAGDWLYLSAQSGIWRADPDTLKAEKIYAPEVSIGNGDTSYMVYGEGRLFIVDGGIVSIDAQTLETRRLTNAYDRQSGDCGYGYILLGGRLYTWSEAEGATVSMDLDGGDVRVVSPTRFYFAQVWRGCVTALTGRIDDGFGGYESCAVYGEPEADPPVFDPENGPREAIDPSEYVFMLGDTRYTRVDDGPETVQLMLF